MSIRHLKFTTDGAAARHVVSRGPSKDSVASVLREVVPSYFSDQRRQVACILRGVANV